MTTITQKTIAKIEPTGAIQFVRDSSLTGFGIKVTAKGKASYFAEARVKGGRTVRKNIADVDLLPLDDARNEARAMLLQLKQGVDLGKLPPPAPRADNSLQHVLDQYFVTRVGLKETTKLDYRKVMRNCFSDLMPLDVSMITPTIIAKQYIRLIKEKPSQAYAQKALRTLKAILNSSGLTFNPVSQFIKESGVATVSDPRTRFLRSQEIARIAEFSRDDKYANPYPGKDAPFCQLLMFYLCTGCRKTEALSLLKTDYDQVNKQLTFRETKNGRPHTIPVVGTIKDALERAIENSNSDKIFDYTDRTVRTKLDKTKAALGFDDWTIHDLRRTFAEHSQLIGVDVPLIASALNHTPTGITATAYLGGGLAKLSMLRDVYERLQCQYGMYWEEGPDTLGELSEGWDTPV